MPYLLMQHPHQINAPHMMHLSLEQPRLSVAQR